MQVKDIMTKSVVAVKPGTLLIEVAEVLHSHNISGVPVVNELGIVEGLITEEELFSSDYKFYLPMYAWMISQTDFVMGASRQALPYEAGRITQITAHDVMNQKVFFAKADMELEKLLPKVAELEQNPIPVVDSTNKLLGIISKGDLLSLMAGVPYKKGSAKNPRFVDKQFDSVASHMSSRFAFIAKARANVWVVTATVLFIIGFIAGVVYVVNPQIFNFQNGRINIEAPQQ